MRLPSHETEKDKEKRSEVGHVKMDAEVGVMCL